MKLEETENLKLQNVSNIQTTTSQINHIHNSDTELSETYTRETQFLKVNNHPKNVQLLPKIRTQHCRMQTKTTR